MDEDQAGEGPITAPRGRRKTRILVAGAILGCGLMLALPNVERVEPLDRSDPVAEALNGLWGRFLADRSDAESTVEEFEAWIQSPAGRGAAEALVPGGGWWTRATEGVVQVGLGPADDDLGLGSAWCMEVERAEWRGMEATLAARDLECVVCHTRVLADPGAVRDGGEGAEVIVESRVPLDEGPDVDLLVHGVARSLGGQAVTPIVGAEDPGGWLVGLPVVLDVAKSAGPIEVHGAHGGSLALQGDPADPIQIHGDVVVAGDLALRGVVRGRGTLVVLGNLFLPGDLIHEGEGGLCLLVEGSLLAGDVLRPRGGGPGEVTGDIDASFNFTVEALARFNGSLAAEGSSEVPFTFDRGAPIPVLQGGRARGDWGDPSLIRRRGIPARSVGPTSVPSEPVWDSVAGLWQAVLGAPHGAQRLRSQGTRLDAVIVVGGAAILVAAGLESHGTGPGEAVLTEFTGSNDGDLTPPGSLRIHGALIAEHAAVHAPRGLLIEDDPRTRGSIRAKARTGLTRRLVQGDSPRLAGVPKAPVLVDAPPGPARLLPTAAPLTASPR